MQKIKNKFKVGEVFEGKFTGVTFSLTDFPEVISNIYHPIMQQKTTLSTITKIDSMTKQDFDNEKVEQFINKSVFTGKGLIVVERYNIDGQVFNIIDVPKDGSSDNPKIFAEQLQKVVVDGHVQGVSLVHLLVKEIDYDLLLNDHKNCPSTREVISDAIKNDYSDIYLINTRTEMAEMPVDSLGGQMTVAFGIARHGRFNLDIVVPWNSKRDMVTQLVSEGYDAVYWSGSEPHSLVLEGEKATDLDSLTDVNIHLSKTIHGSDIPADLQKEMTHYVSIQTTHLENLVNELFGDLGNGTYFYSLCNDRLTKYHSRSLATLINFVAVNAKQFLGHSLAIEVLKNYKTLSYMEVYVPFDELASLTEVTEGIYEINQSKYPVHDFYLKEVNAIEHKDGNVTLHLENSLPLNEGIAEAIKPFEEKFKKYMGGPVGSPNQYVRDIVTNPKEDFLDSNGVQVDDNTTIKIVSTDINGYGLYHLYNDHPKQGGQIFHATREPIASEGENYATVGSTSRDLNEIYRSHLNNSESTNKGLVKTAISSNPLD